MADFIVATMLPDIPLSPQVKGIDAGRTKNSGNQASNDSHPHHLSQFAK